MIKLVALLAAAFVSQGSCTGQELQPEVLHSFSAAEGAKPRGGLVPGADGSFYGVTSAGGTNGFGSVFQCRTNGEVSMLWSFGDGSELNPGSGLTLGPDGNLYGTTVSGGSANPSVHGTIFRLTPEGAHTTLAVFNGTNGHEALGRLCSATGGEFWGTTVAGGDNDAGVIFKVATNGVLTRLVSFTDFDPPNLGANPYGGLVGDGAGNFYGTTAMGGLFGFGTVFKLTSGGALTTLASLDGIAGYFPTANLIWCPDGSLLVPAGGGDFGYGMIFRVTTNGLISVLASFNSTNGSYPNELVAGPNGAYYGSCFAGGSQGYGTLFKLYADGRLNNLFNFDRGHGAYPETPLTLGQDGNVYGISSEGGEFNQGVIFRLNLVAAAPRIESLRYTNGATLLAWHSVVGRAYQVQYNSTVTAADWTNLGGAVTATNVLTSITDSPSPILARFYRVQLLPY